MLVHKMRTETPAILIGTNTAINDNPSLTTRYWYGKNPVRVILDRQRRIPSHYQVFDGEAETLIFTETVETETQEGNVRLFPLHFDQQMIKNLLTALHCRRIDALLVEGGRSVLQSFIDASVWDEAFIEISETEFGAGIPAPVIRGELLDEVVAATYRQQHIGNKSF
jgi:diaminohydroxyphosphoribosylaminopyrimidine deaminase/5-amino-6-(5-phosphoribosylamino)uracil reductase